MSSDELRCMNWQSMIKPKSVAITSTPNYGKFVCEPLERGFGTTLGNSLRRVILSSLYGAAITSVKFEDVMHEFSVIPGILEDVSEIILNLKEIRFKMGTPEPQHVRIEASGEGIVTAKDIITNDAKCEILNPDHKIATLNQKAKLNMTMEVRVGKGYSLAEANTDQDAPIGTIPVDAIFSPIKKVVFVVGNARVGQQTDYDKMTLEVWTDGSIVPDDAVAYASKILKEHMTIFINFDDEAEPEQTENEEKEEQQLFNENLFRSVEELELSVRSANCLKNADILKLYQLVTRTEGEMLKTKNFGRKSLNEIKEVLGEMGLFLGMELDGFVPPEEEIEEGA